MHVVMKCTKRDITIKFYIDDWNDFCTTKTFEGYRGISVHQFNEMIKGARKTYF